MLSYLISRLLGLSTFTQVLYQLPLTLDWLGPPSFLFLSLLLFLYQCSYATFRLLTKNTPLASLMGLWNLVNPFVPTLCALATCWMYLYPPEVGISNSNEMGTAGMGRFWVGGWKRFLGVVLPGFYAQTLRLVSPIFSLLEGFATLLIAQLAGRMTKGFIEDSPIAYEKEEFEWRRLSFLVISSIIYCSGATWLVISHPLSPPFSKTQLPPIFLGLALATVFFLTIIAFSRRTATSVETSLIFVYIVYGAWMSGKEELMEPRDFGSGWLTTGWGQAKTLSSQPTFSSIPISSVNLDTTSPKSILAAFLSTIGFAGAVLARLFGINIGFLSTLGGLGKVGEYINMDPVALIKPGHDLDVVGLAMGILNHASETMFKIAKSLPPTLLISLCYRLLVLHTAARFIPAIKRAASGWDEPVERVGSGEVGEKSSSSFWSDGRSFSEERASSRVTTILLSYRRAILIAVYTHLLLLDNGSQVWWRWVNIFVTLGVWALELNVDRDDFDDDGESIVSWNRD